MGIDFISDDNYFKYVYCNCCCWICLLRTDFSNNWLYRFKNGHNFIICYLFFDSFFGRYVILEDIIKLISSILLLSTLSAFIVCVVNGPTEVSDNFIRPVLSDKKSILFIIALMGWMPTAVDLSTWNSIWTIEKLKISKNSFKEIMFDFRFGYFITIILSLFFLTLGCYLMFGSGNEIPILHLFLPTS